MLRHYLMMTARSFVRHKLYSLINVIGLSVALTCVIFVILFARNELSYDKWIPGTEDLYRVELTARMPGRPPFHFADSSYPLGTAMRDQLPGVTGMTRLQPTTLTFANGDRQFLEKKVDFVDPNFFRIIRLPLIEGNPDTVLSQPESVVLSETAARKYFGNTDPLGRTLTTDTGSCPDPDAGCRSGIVSLRVTGVMRDLPQNTQLTGDVLIPTESLADPVSPGLRESWFFTPAVTYVTLAPAVSPESILAAMPGILDQNVTGVLRKMGIAWRGSQAYAIHLTPFTEVHLSSSRWQNNLKPPGSWETLYGVIVIGILILLVACFNFINLATARAELRAREIGVRKVLGGTRGQLSVQFLSEAVLLALLSLVCAGALTEILLPAFNALLHQSVALNYWSDWKLNLILIGVAVGAGLISGAYPALVLSSLRPVSSLRAKPGSSRSAVGLRDLLVLTQFAVSIGLGIAVIVVFRQVSYSRDMDLGFRRDNIVVIRNDRLKGEKQDAFAQALRANSSVTEVGLSEFVPFQPGVNVATIEVPGQPYKFTLNGVISGPDYPRVYGIPLVSGRLLSSSRPDDRFSKTGGNVLVNVAGARRLGFTPQTAIGQTIVADGASGVHIVGVIGDTKTQGAREPVEPTIYVYIPELPMNFSVRLRPGRVPQTLKFIDQTWRSFVPTVAIQRTFLTGAFSDLYRSDQQQGTLFGVFVIVAIVIGCLGLYGLVVFTSERRTKEVAVRKISGAHTIDILKIMLWRISLPVLLADVIAWPVAYHYLQRWLQGFASHIWLNPLYFVAASAIALLIAWTTVFLHTLRLARTSPVHALRWE